MLKSISIREININDIDILSKLIFQLGYQISLNDMKQTIITYLHNSNYRAYVAIANEKLIGVAAIIINDYFHKNEKFAIVSTLIVDENFRGKKVGTMLMDFIEKYAKEKGCICMELKSGQHRVKDGTHNFYKDRGYVDNGINQIYFKKSLV